MDLQEYLKTVIQFSKKSGHKNIGEYSCFEEFVYKNGQLFKSQIYPKNLKRSRMKECYRNALMLMLDNPSYFYVEGYAISIIPTMHAWCVDKNKNIIDPTWKDGKEYFGIIFKRDFVCKEVIKNKRAGLIDNWQEGWPLLKSNPIIYKE